jgi:hypothetical protein
MADLYIYETYDGGDSVLVGNDLKMTNGLHNFPYFGLFGGNPEQNTKQNRQTGEIALDWWGNSLLEPITPLNWINSRLEKTLETIALTSANRFNLINTVKSDLKFLKEFVTIEVDVRYTGVDEVLIQIKLIEPETLTENIYIFIWNSTEQELKSEFIIPDDQSGTGIALNTILNFPL